MLTVSPDIAEFLKNSHVMVLATASANGIPHAASVFYATDTQMNIYFLTKDQTTKSRNIIANPQVAAVVYDAEMLRTTQITGNAKKVEDPQMMQKAQEVMERFAKQIAGAPPPVTKLDAGEYILYRITPQSIRLADYKYGSGDTMFEVAAPAEESLEA